RRAAELELHRRIPPEQQIFGSGGGMSVAAREPARRVVPGGLRGTDRAAPAERAARNAAVQSTRACRSSYSEEPGGCGPRAAARVGRRGQQTGTPHSISCYDSE